MFSADLGGYTAPLPAATDPPFQKVALLLHGDGTNGAQNNTFVDSSTNNFTITRTGNVAQGTFSPFSLTEGQWSNYFDGTGDYLTAPDNTSLDMGSSSFTVEGWFYVGTVTGTYLPIVTRFNGSASAASHLQYFVYQSGSSLIMKAYGSTVVTITFSSALTVGNWYHFALVRDGNTISGYLNGVKNATTGTITGSLYTGAWLTYIGGYREGTTWYYANGYISNVRIVNGTALYTGSTYTVPTDGLTAITNTSLLTCQSNRFKDNSSNNFTITPAGDTKVTAFSPFAPSAAYSASTNGGSGYFDGSGDYLTVPSTDGFAFGTGDATVEFWSYPTAATASGYIFDFRYIGNQLGYFYYNNSTTQYEWYFCGFGSGGTLGSNGLNAWTHWAIVRNSGTVTLYINGVSVTSGSGTASMSATGCSIGSRYSLDAPFYPGYISNLRFVKGTAVYTANFTPPTAPLTAVANTQLLLNCTNAGIIDNAGKNDIETGGNVQISTSVKKYGTGSMYFDGTGDYLVGQTTPNLAFGTGNFTVEFWLYLNAVTNYGVFDLRTTGNQMVPVIYIAANGSMRYHVYGVDRITGSILSSNMWYHVALSKSGTTTKLFINGTQSGSTYTDSNNYLQSRFVIGTIGDSVGSWSLNGYIDDLRITKGQALYTSNFTPPTQAFPNV